MPPRFSREPKDGVILYGEPSECQPKTSPCQYNCPAGNPIQTAHALIEKGRFVEAATAIRSRNPLTGITGRVCHHPCQGSCNRSQLDEEMSIMALERAAFEHGGGTVTPTRSAPSGKKVAIVGSGPAGLTAAYFLALFGHEVVVFEALPFLGGIPRVAIPDFLLPKEIVDREAARVLELGVRVNLNTRVGRDLGINEIMERFDACLLAAGAWRAKNLNIPGGELAVPALDFLIRSNLERPSLPAKVIVIGGGGVAIDAARWAKRRGASEVDILCLEPEDSMPAYPEDIEQAKKEGASIYASTAPTRILTSDGRVTGMECVRIGSFEFQQGGGLRVEPEPGSERSFEAELVIAAIGEVLDTSIFEGASGITVTSGRLDVDPLTFSTSRSGLFAAGDMVSGPGSVAQGVGSGRKAAVSIDAFLRGRSLEEVRQVSFSRHEGFVTNFGRAEEQRRVQHVVQYSEMMNIEHFEKLGAVRVPREGYGPAEAQREASRCFHCGHCFSCETCVDVCPGDVLAMVDGEPRVVYPDECIHCGACMVDCPAGAVSFRIPLPMRMASYPEGFFGRR